MALNKGFVPAAGETDPTKLADAIRQIHQNAASASAEFITSSATADLSAERVLTNTATVTWDFSTAGQAKANAAAGRIALTGNTTYYVRTDGNDANDGLTNSSGGAFLTLQKAINVFLTLDLGGFAGTIQVGNGTYTAGAWLQSAFVGGSVTLKGDTTTPANVIISTTSVAAIRVTNAGSILYVQGLKLTTATTESCLYAENGGTINVNGKMEYGAVAYFHLQAINFGIINVSVGYTISGGGLYHYNSTTGTVLVYPAMTITLTGTPAFAGAFVGVTFDGTVNALGHTFSGAATGTRYIAQSNGAIQTNGGGANYFPGNAAGFTATGGQYI